MGRTTADSIWRNKVQINQTTTLEYSMSRFHLYLDTSKFVKGSALYQIQNGKPKLIAYTSKRLPVVARNYSIMEWELYHLAINIASFSHLSKRVDFDAIVDHIALTHIINKQLQLG